MIHYAPRIPADPLTCSVGLRSATKLETHPCRLYEVSIPGIQGHPRVPPIKPHPRGPKGRGLRAPSAPFGGWAHGALWGYSEAIPRGKPFRMEGSFEIKVVGGLGFETVPEIDKNYTKINHLEHLGSLGQEGLRNYLKTDPLEHPSGERPWARNGSETDRWLL